MKKRTFFYGLLAAITLAGCSSSDDVTAEGGNSDVTISDGNPRYLMVKIADVSQASTRATGDFVVGSSDENNVSKVRFFFFNSDGSAANVKSTSSGYVNYVDWVRKSDTADNYPVTDASPNNVEDTLAAYIVINTKENDKIPTKMLAVANFTDDMFSTVTLNNGVGLSTLRELSADYASLANATSPKFVMVNSVYLTSDNERVTTTTIPTSSLITKGKNADGTDEDDKTVQARAQKNPVKMYVERNVAKVLVSKSGTATDFTIGNNNYKGYQVMDKTDKTKALELSTNAAVGTTDQSATKYQYYFVPQGWGLTATTNKAYLSKHIERWSLTSWSTSSSVGNEWTDPSNHRSYWAKNVFSGNNEEFTSNSNNNAGRTYDKNFSDFNTDFDKYVYTNENAATHIEGGARDYPTQVVVAGTLYQKKVDGTNSSNESYEVATLCDYEGAYYTDMDAVKNAMAAKIQLYMKDDKNTYTKVPESAYELVTASTLLENTGGSKLSSQEGDPRCYVQLWIKGLTWDKSDANKCSFTYTSGGSSVPYTGYLYATNESSTYETKAEIRSTLQGGGKALVYKDGKTYYWFKIPHLASKDRGQYGVVRNHFYKITAGSIVGVGTPIYDPEETIYPETPVDVDTYIAAEVNILSWKSIETSIDLGE